MSGALKEFSDKTAYAHWAMVYHVGHGIEVNAVSYLVPTDAKLLHHTHIMEEALPLDRVLGRMESARLA